MIDTDAIVALERSARAALPAGEEVAAGDWVLRISGGATKRVNSANPIAPGARVEAIVGPAETAYRAHALPVRFRLTPLAHPSADAVLAASGHARIDNSWTMAAPTAGRAIDPDVMLALEADDAWCAAFAAVSGWSPADTACHRSLLRRASRLAVATLVEDRAPIGFGAASIAEGRAWLFDVATHADARGRGVARRIVGSLLGWAAADGADEALLQVLADNGPARRLYRSLGFRDVYPYHYRIGQSGE